LLNWARDTPSFSPRRHPDDDRAVDFSGLAALAAGSRCGLRARSGRQRGPPNRATGGRYTLIAYIQPSLAHLIVEPLPHRCALSDDPRARRGNGEVQTVFDCGGAPLAVDDTLVLPWKREGILLSAHWHDGSFASRFFTANGGLITVALSSLRAGSGSLGDAALRYTVLGIEHILFGIDHLLFIFGLLLIVRSRWMLVKTITAFTIAHSITLGLATLGFVHVPSGPVEAGIALSIVFVAAEGLRDGPQGWALRHPWSAALVFGLLHGFGFAGAALRNWLAGTRNPGRTFVLQPRRRNWADHVRGRDAGHPIRPRAIGIPLTALDTGNPWLCHRHHRNGVVHRTRRRYDPDLISPDLAVLRAVVSVKWGRRAGKPGCPLTPPLGTTRHGPLVRANVPGLTKRELSREGRGLPDGYPDPERQEQHDHQRRSI
jgi:hydrogenase/urease accessory protein HupE